MNDLAAHVERAVQRRDAADSARPRGERLLPRLASGLPLGGDLESADEVTLGRALAGRREL